jgi:amidase
MKESRSTAVSLRTANSTMLFAIAVLVLLCGVPSDGRSQTKAFHLQEATIEDVHGAFKSGRLTARQLVQLYLDRIEAYDKKGTGINSIITVNSKALEEADRLDAAFRTSGPVGPLHGIPVILKDQIDAKGMPTTLGSVVFKDYYPDKDAFVVDKLKKAGAIILAKATLGEGGGGDTHGSLFGSTRNPYALDRTVGGSSGGPGASLAANLGAVALGQEGYASIRRPAAWNSVVGMRTTAGLVSRSGVWGGWPSQAGHAGPMARTVRDLARILDVVVGYDPEDPLTAYSLGNIPESYTKFLDKDGLKGARIGAIREPMGYQSEPGSQDFQKVTAVFDKAIAELKAAGAAVVDPIVIPKLNELQAKRAGHPDDAEQSFKMYFARSANPPFKSRQDIVQRPDLVAKMFQPRQSGWRPTSTERSVALSRHHEYLLARGELMTNILKVMADNKLDAILYKTVEHQPTLISDGIKPPYVNMKGVPALNTFLVFVPVISVPAGFTVDNLPVGITFQGRPYSDATMIKLAYAYEQATLHRKPPSTTPALPREP